MAIQEGGARRVFSCKLGRCATSDRSYLASCPSGQRDLTVNQTAQPSEVRILYLPPYELRGSGEVGSPQFILLQWMRTSWAPAGGGSDRYVGAGGVPVGSRILYLPPYESRDPAKSGPRSSFCWESGTCWKFVANTRRQPHIELGGPYLQQNSGPSPRTPAEFVAPQLLRSICMDAPALRQQILPRACL